MGRNSEKNGLRAVTERVRRGAPEVVAACRECKETGATLMIDPAHYESASAEEMLLLGSVMRYARAFGVQVLSIGDKKGAAHSG